MQTFHSFPTSPLVKPAILKSVLSLCFCPTCYLNYPPFLPTTILQGQFSPYSLLSFSDSSKPQLKHNEMVKTLKWDRTFTSLPLPFSSYLILGELHHLSEVQFLQLNTIGINTYLIRLLRELNETTYTQHNLITQYMVVLYFYCKLFLLWNHAICTFRTKHFVLCILIICEITYLL